MCFRLVWGLSLFEVAILLTCALMPGSPFCRGQWLWKSQTCTKKKGWVPWFCREDALLHLWQVPDFVEVWGPKSQVWLYKMGTPNPPSGHFLGDQIILILQKIGNVEQELPLQNGFFPRASERRVLPIVGVCKTSSHLHILSSSHLLIFTSSHIFSHLLTSSHIFSHLLTSSHLHIFTSSHIFSHLLTSSHIFSHLLTSSLIFSHLLTSSHIFSHLLTSSHIFSSLHLLISHLLLLPSCPLLLFYFFLEGGSRGSGNETARNATLSHEMRFDRQKLR